MRTYVVRIAEPRPDEAGSGSLHGVVEEISTGVQVRFGTGAQLLDVFEAAQLIASDARREP